MELAAGQESRTLRNSWGNLWCPILRLKVVTSSPFLIFEISTRNMSLRHLVSSNVRYFLQNLVGKSPTIEGDVFIETCATVLGPITVGRSAIIGANTLVVKDVPAQWLEHPSESRGE